MEFSDMFMTQADVVRAVGIPISTNIPHFIGKFKTPTVNIAGRRGFYKQDGEKLVQQIKDYYEKNGGHIKERSITGYSPQAQAMQTPREQV